MIKAFLSHSSVDKQIVRKIKEKLQRAWTYFDEDCFEAGVDFREAITKRLDNTNLFVLFVSSSSLKSSWVQFEIDEAYWQIIQRNNIQILVLTLEDISVSQLPKWMRKAKFETVKTPQLAAQIIKHTLYESFSISNRVYIGRENSTKKFFDDITSYEPNFPNVLGITGLNGIGRRTFIKDILSKRFSLDYATKFYMDESDGLIELYKKLLDDNMEDLASERVSEQYSWFLSVSFLERANEIARMLALYTQNRTCPIIIDNGAMLNDDGYYRNDLLTVLHCFAQNHQDNYLILIHTRLPKLRVADKQLVYVHRLYALDPASCYYVFDSLLRRNGVPVSDYSQVKEISNYLEGYPPAIINAARECAMEGVDIVCNDKSNLVDFQARLFSKYLDKTPLSSLDLEILTAIYNLGNVSIQVLTIIMEESGESIATSLRNCHDYNIVEQRSDGTYAISPPMKTAIDRKLSRYDKKAFSDVANALIEHFWKPDSNINFEIIDIIINTVLRSGQEDNLVKFKEYILPSHLLKAAEKANKDTDWYLAEKYARKALELDNGLNDARVLLFKELVRQETSKNLAQYDTEENEILETLRKSYDNRYYYLEGFRNWKRYRFYEAIESFRLAIISGDDSIPTHRDLAECYYQTNQVQKAQEEITNVIGTRKISNPFILDLASKIAISLGDLQLADNLLSQQELVDRYENIEHRRATYYIKNDDYETAFLHSSNACRGERVLPEMHLLHMNIAIHLKKYDIVEEEYKIINSTYKHYSFDTCEALYATMLLNVKGWKAAEAGFIKISKKESPFARNLKYKIIVEKLGDTMISPLVRKATEIEKSEIEGKKMLDVLYQLQYYDLR